MIDLSRDNYLRKRTWLLRSCENCSAQLLPNDWEGVCFTTGKMGCRHCLVYYPGKDGHSYLMTSKDAQRLHDINAALRGAKRDA